MESEARFEAVMSTAQAGAEVALKSAGGVTRELRKARAAAASGQVRELRRALSAAAEMAGDLTSAVHDTQSSFDFDESAYLSSGEYAKELLALAAERGLSMFEEDDRLLSYPSIVKIVAGDAAIEIDRKRERRLRPSVLVDLLLTRQSRPPKFKAEPFLESLASGYDFVVAKSGKQPGTVARLQEIWTVLTLLPGQSREYTRQEFARDLYQLDLNGVRTTKNGRAMRLHASSGTRTPGVLTTVARTGQQQVYWGVSFTDQASR